VQKEPDITKSGKWFAIHEWRCVKGETLDGPSATWNLAGNLSAVSDAPLTQ